MSQKAAVYAKKHEYPVVQERKIPTPAANQLLVKVTSVGLNPIEWKLIDYALFREPPRILGFDIAGVVHEVGSHVTNYKKGDRIVSWAHCKTDDESGWQQFALVDSAPNITAKLPDNVTDDDGATLPTALNTAQVALYDKEGFGFPSPFTGGESFGKNKAILVLGGSSVIGLAGIQLSRLSGFNKIIATSSKKHETLLKKMGATDVIDRSLSVEEQVKQIKSISPSLEYAWDAIGSKETAEIAASSFGSKGGKIVSSLPVNVEVLAANKNVTGTHIISNPYDHVKSATEMWSHVEEALRNGDIIPLPYKVKGGLASSADALRAVKSASGYKVIVHPQE